MRSVCCSHSPIRIVSPNANVEMMHAISWPMAVAPSLHNPDPLGSEDYLVIADLDGGTQWARIDLAAPVKLRELETLYADQIQVVDEVLWDDTAQVVRATRQRRLSSLVLSEQGLSKPDPSMISTALLEGIRRAGTRPAGLDSGAASVAGASGISTPDRRTRVTMARSVGRGAAADARRLAWSLFIRANDARASYATRSHPAVARAPLLGTVAPTRTLGPHPSDGPERIERSRGIRDA